MGCPNGLCDTVVPVRLGDRVIGFLQTGQVFRKKPTQSQFEKVAKQVRDWGVEVDFATDQPDVEKKHNGDVKIGKGPILPRGANINPALLDLLAETAAENKIPVQFTGIPRATGTDANVMQISRGGVATALVKIPLRYMHTPVEVLSLSDLENAVKLIVATLAKIKGRSVFIPS